MILQYSLTGYSKILTLPFQICFAGFSKDNLMETETVFVVIMVSWVQLVESNLYCAVRVKSSKEEYKLYVNGTKKYTKTGNVYKSLSVYLCYKVGHITLMVVMHEMYFICAV